jgi:hypothetical protein
MTVVHLLRAGVLMVLLAGSVSLLAGDQRQIVADVASTAQISLDDAARITNAIIAFMQDLEWRIGYIASSTDSPAQKDRMAQETIVKCFVSEESEVQVVNVRTKAIATYKVRFYLFRLARLRKIYGYTDVQLYFRPNYLGFGRVRKIADSTSRYEVSVSAEQIFIAKREDIVAYRDITKKKFRVRFTSASGGTRIKVDEILVGENFEGPELTQEP